MVLLLSQGQIAAEFDESKLEDVLGAIPEDLPSRDLCPWFRTVFVPFVRRVLPTGQVGGQTHTFIIQLYSIYIHTNIFNVLPEL